MSIFEYFSEDQIRLLSIIIVSFPLAFIMSLIKNILIRKYFNIVCGLTMQILMYKESYINIIISTLIVYSICKRAIITKNKLIGTIVMIYTFIHLSILHLYRQIFDYGSWRMDITLLFMMLSLKFISFGFSVDDGLYSNEENNQIAKINENFVIKEINFIDFVGYVVFFPSSLMGPFFEYRKYVDYINVQNGFENVPFTLVYAFKRFCLAVAFCIIYIFIKNIMTVDNFFESENKIFVFSILMCQKYKYYIGFLFAESICIVSGISYKESTEMNNFDGIVNVHIVPCETSFSVKHFFQHWNISVHNFLKRNIYLRYVVSSQQFHQNSKKNDEMSDKKNIDQKTNLKAQLITFAASAIWHGFYPSYYIIFIHFAIGMIVEKQIEDIKKIHPNRVVSILFRIVFIIGFFLIGNYLFGVLEALDFSKCVKFMSYFYFIPSIFLFTVPLIFQAYINLKKKSHEQHSQIHKHDK